ncbi:MAG: transposase [Bacteroidales bacterium]|nr:transposase [Bacteroidales bacterium]
MSSLSALQELVSLMLPPTILDYFDVVRVEERAIGEKERKGLERGEVIIHLDEHNEFRTPEVFSNGDTRPQLLVRSRYLLFKSADKWTDSQKERAKILFEQYPDREQAYWLTHKLRMIYANTPRRSLANTRLAKWYVEVENSGFNAFNVITATLRDRETEIINFFDNRATNASAESFNCKIKTFRAQLRGVSDINNFLFRLQNTYA